MSKFVTIVRVNGVDKKADVVGNSPEPVATFDGVNYYHKIETKDLDKNVQYYDLEGNAYSQAPEYPYITTEKRGNVSWKVVSSATGGSGQRQQIFISDENGNSGAAVIPGVQTISKTIQGDTLNAEYFVNGYCVVNEDKTGVFYYNLVGEGEITGPVSNEEFDRKASELSKSIQAIRENYTPELDLTNKSSTLYVSDILNALGIELPSSGKVYVLVPNIKYKTIYGYRPVGNTGSLALSISSNEMRILRLDIFNENYIEHKSVTYTAQTISSVEVNLDSYTHNEFLPSVPSVTTGKTYVLKLVSGQTKWVEETA